MKPINRILNACRDFVRAIMRRVARGLQTISGDRITPNFVTLTGLLMHLPIAWLIGMGYFGYAAAGLVIFGLFDTLDGELARLQNRASSAGMLLDATTDRMKEVMLYMGVAYFFVLSGQPYMAVWAVAAVGGSLLVSYVKAKGETAAKGANLSTAQLNQLFADGLLRFELRMFLLIVGLLFSVLPAVVITITVLAWMTAFERLIKISRKL